MKRKVVPTKASPLSMGYRKPAFLSGVASLVKNASQAQHHKLKEKIERNLFAGSFHCVKI